MTTTAVGSQIAARRMQWWVGAAVASITIGLIVVGLAWTPDSLGAQAGVSVWLAVTVVIAGVLVARVPGNPVGWLLAAVAACISLQSAALGVAAQVEAGRLSAAAAWLSHWVALPGFASFAFLVVVFPTGRLPSQRWRWVVWSLTLGVVLLSVAVAFAPGMVGGVGVGNPYAWDAGAGLLRTLDRVAGLLLTAGAAGAVASLVVRFRRSRGDERQQLKWFLLAIVVLVVALAFAAVASGPLNELSFVLAVIALTGVPVAVGVAILEYHLYDIDQVINRALVYGALTVVVAGLYVASVGLITVSFDRSLGLAASLMATVVVAVAFQPLRARLQRVADQLVYGQRNEPAAALSTLARQLHAAPDPRAVPEQIVVTVASALKLPYVAIELDRDDGARLVAERGDRPREVERIPIEWRSEQLGGLIVGGDTRLRAGDHALLRDVARQAAPALAAIQLTRALERSRQQLVVAREEERRRLRGDLHDGLGPQLAGIAMGLDAVSNLIDADPRAARHAVARVRERSHQALDTVRAVSRGLRPPVLDDLGLIDAVREHAGALATAAHRVDVVASGDLTDLPAAVEVAAYHICLESITNAVRHAHATTTRVEVHRDERSVHLEISDDGRGIPHGTSPGVGLSSMRDRAEELGGVCIVSPRAPRGTTVRAVLPV